MIEELREEFNRRIELLNNFYGDQNTPIRTVKEENKDNIPEYQKELLELGYIKWSNTIAVTTKGRYCSLFPSRRGEILRKTASILEKI